MSCLPAIALILAQVSPAGQVVEGDVARPSLDIHIDPSWQKAKLAACQDRMAYFQRMGVWKGGSAAPVVERGAWEKLDQQEKTEIFEIAACIAASGQWLELMVTVLESEHGTVLETRRVVSNRDFLQKGQ